MSDSLVRVSRRAEWGAHKPVPGARRYIAETARAANHDRHDGISTNQSAPVHAPSRSADWLSPFHIRPGRIAGPHSLPSLQFQALFDSLFKVLFIFPSQYLFAIGLMPVFSLRQNVPPYWGCIPKQPDSQTAPRGATGSRHDGDLTLSGAPFQGTWARSAAEDASPDYNSDSEAARFSSWADPGSLAVTKGILEATTNMHTANGTKLETSFSFVVFLRTYRAGVCYGAGLKSMAPQMGQPQTKADGVPAIGPRPIPLTPGYRYMFMGRSALQGSTMILPQVHLRKPCYDFSFL
ncbi:hypothetical protein L2E82_50577 [Cichorium intybus]|nr:hypothetical protein L2E82_50577 [Cichorium intybus]